MIAYYRPDVRCWRTWMSLMFHMLDCMRVNSYVACKNMGYKGTHKEFTMEWCEALFARTKAEDVRETRKRRSNANDREASPTDSIGSNKKRRMSHTRPELPDHRLQGHKEDHHLVSSTKSRACTYCSYMAALNKLAGLPVSQPTRTKYYCFACGDYLCKDHLECFHGREDDTADIPREAI